MVNPRTSCMDCDWAVGFSYDNEEVRKELADYERLHTEIYPTHRNYRRNFKPGDSK